MKTTCLFWNLHKSKSTFPLVTQIVRENDVDIVFLCEFPQNEEKDLENRLIEVKLDFHIVTFLKANTKFRVYSTLKNGNLHVIREEDKYSVFELISGSNLLMCVCHLSSLLHYQEADKRSEARNLSNYLKILESETGNTNLIVFGDFNIDPYHDGMLECDALNAVKEINLAQKTSRTRENVEYPFFYNPMWSLWANDRDVGTYYYPPTHIKSEVWHIFDQVLIRPHLMNQFEMSKLRIITETATVKLLTSSGIIDKKYSDHLPIIFEIKQ